MVRIFDGLTDATDQFGRLSSRQRPLGQAVERGDHPHRERLARVAIEREVAKLLGRRSQWIEAQGGVPSIEGSMHKLFSDETTVRAASDLIDIFGSDGALEVDEEGAPAGGQRHRAG